MSVGWGDYGRYHVKVEVDLDDELPLREVVNVEKAARAIVGANVLSVQQRISEFKGCTCTCSCDYCLEAQFDSRGPVATLLVRAWLVARDQRAADADVRGAVEQVVGAMTQTAAA